MRILKRETLPLAHCAIQSGDVEIAKTILQTLIQWEMDRGNDLANAQKLILKKSEMTLFECALASDKLEQFHHQATPNRAMVNLLMELNVKPTRVDMDIAVIKASMTLMNYCLERGVPLDEESASCYLLDLLYHLTGSDKDDALSKKHKKMFLFLLGRGANINVLDIETDNVEDIETEGNVISRLTPLHIAIAHSHYSWVKLILSQNPDMDIQDEEHHTALQQTIWHSNFKMAKLILKAKPDVNAINADGFSALSLLCSYPDHIEESEDIGYEEHVNAIRGSERIKLVNLLLQHGAELIVKGQPEDMQPLFLARKNGLHKIVKILKNHTQTKTLPQYRMD